MKPKAPPATSRGRKPQPPAREAKRPAKGAVKGRKQGAGKAPKRKPKLTAKQAQELAARRAAWRRVLLVVGDYTLGLAMLTGAVWWLVVFLEKA
jgi:hypothetical protein